MSRNQLYRCCARNDNVPVAPFVDVWAVQMETLLSIWEYFCAQGVSIWETICSHKEKNMQIGLPKYSFINNGFYLYVALVDERADTVSVLIQNGLHA